jgi:hypothetical protein
VMLGGINSNHIIRFLIELRLRQGEQKAAILWDNASVQTSKQVREFLADKFLVVQNVPYSFKYVGIEKFLGSSNIVSVMKITEIGKS